MCFFLLFIAKEREVFGERRGFMVVKSSEAINLLKNDKADVFCSQQTSTGCKTAGVFARSFLSLQQTYRIALIKGVSRAD